MSEVGKAEAQAPASETVAETQVEETKVEAAAEAAETEEATEAETAEPPVEGAEVVETEEEKKTKSKLRREKQQARERALSEQVADLQQRLAAAERTKPAADGLGPRPDRSSYEDEAEYAADLAAWKIEEKITARQAKAHETTVSELRGEAAAKQMERFKERLMTLKPEYPDIEKVLTDSTLPMSAAMANVIMKADRGPEIAHHLLANREVAQSIKEMPPEDAAFALGKIAENLSRPKPRTETKAPPPPSTVSGSVKGPAKNPETMSQAEYVRWRQNGGGERRTG